MNEIKIGSAIQSLRKKNTITQEELAGRLGVTNQAVSKWESVDTTLKETKVNPRYYNIAYCNSTNPKRLKITQKNIEIYQSSTESCRTD